MEDMLDTFHHHRAGLVGDRRQQKRHHILVAPGDDVPAAQVPAQDFLQRRDRAFVEDGILPGGVPVPQHDHAEEDRGAQALQVPRLNVVKLPEGFRYASNTNTEWLDLDGVKEMIRPFQEAYEQGK